MKIRLFSCAVVFLFSGCASMRSIPEPDVATGYALSEIETEKGCALTSMRVISKIDYVDGVNGKRVVGQDLVFSARPPLDMRITISAFDKAVSTLVSDGAGFALIDVGQNVFVAGEATPENISQILPVYLSAADLFRVIYGDFPRDGLAADAFESQMFAWDPEKGGYRRTLGLADGRSMHVIYEWPSKAIKQIAVLSGEKVQYAYEASGFEAVTGASGLVCTYPREILFSLPDQKTDVRLRIEKRDMDVEFSEAVFQLIPPAGSQIVIMQ
ncbi:MAG: hypothetical protein IJ165_07745 [Proteobacteria bacterium]|nr:hypothetical protein [Pseudomonadota bacterium]